MGKRIKLTKTDVFLLGLTVLFVLAMALTWLLTPRQVRGGYDISAVPPEEAAPALLKVNINTAGAEELDGLPVLLDFHAEATSGSWTNGRPTDPIPARRT